MKWPLFLALSFGCSADGTAPEGAGDGATADLGGDAAPEDAARPADAAPPAECIRPHFAGGPPLDAWTDGAHRAWVEVGGHPCRRRFQLHTTQPLRDGQPANPRTIAEAEGNPTVRTNSPMFDALYALAIVEAEENAVDAIREGGFRDGEPIPCAPGGCYQTGALWHYVWTRDTAYAADLGLASLDPGRVRNSLEFKLSTPRAGGGEQIMQDTGTGGSYPVSSDRVVWSMGARALLHQLRGPARARFADRALVAARNTADHDRQVLFDPVDGLYRGEQSFLDWREQSYPAWTAGHMAHIGASKALSTNIAHLINLELVRDLRVESGATAEPYADWADTLRAAIRARFWLDDAGLFATFVTTHLDPAPARQFDLLGNALAVVSGVASAAQAQRVVAGYPHVPRGAPVIWPQQQLTPIYHNRAQWPFVTAYWLRAARQVGNVAVAERALDALMRGAALNQSHMENFEMVSGAPFVDDGPYAGPVVNSRRQLWSVAGYLPLVHEVIFGLRPTDAGLSVAPFVPRAWWDRLFGAAENIVLEGYPWRGRRLTVVLNRTGTGVPTDRLLVPAQLPDGAVIEAYPLDATGGTATVIEAVDDYQALFAPRVPAVEAVVADANALSVRLGIADEAAADIRVRVDRDGERLTELPGGTTAWTDVDARPDGPSVCYTIETVFIRSGNTSQRADPQCWWGPDGDRIIVLDGDDLEAQGGRRSDQHGRPHVEVWADQGQALRTGEFTVPKTGRWRLQAVYGNGAGPVSTGITCAVLRVTLVTEQGSEAAGYLPLPHTGDWAEWRDSTTIPVELEAGVSYRVLLDGEERAINMSGFDHFAEYTGGPGGVDGPFNRANISAIKLLGP